MTDSDKVKPRPICFGTTEHDQCVFCRFGMALKCYEAVIAREDREAEKEEVDH